MGANSNILQYARQGSQTPRPPLFAMVICVLFATFLIVLGGLICVGSLLVVADCFRREPMYRRKADLWLLLLIAFAIGVSMCRSGVKGMTYTIRVLRGTEPPETRSVSALESAATPSEETELLKHT